MGSWWGKRVMRRVNATAQRCRKLLVEPLEQRYLLTVSTGSEYDQVSSDWLDVLQQPVVSGASVATAAEIATVNHAQVDQLHLDSAGDRWLVRLSPQGTSLASSVSGAAGILTNSFAQFRVLAGLGLPGQVLVEVTNADARTAAAVLGANRLVASFEPDQKVAPQQTPNDPQFSFQAGLNNTGQGGGLNDADIDAPEAWNVTNGTSDIVVAVVDSGIDYNHPDLAENIWTNPGEIPGNAIDDDDNGFVDDVYGYDFHNNDSDPRDDHRHGTHVAGIIGARGNNGIGVTGVAWTTSLMAVKFLDENNEGSTADAVRAINYVTLMRQTYEATKGTSQVLGANVHIINASWGSYGEFSQTLYNAIELAGNNDILFVAAAGNGDALGRGINLDQNQPFYPASFDLPNIISVAATDQSDQLARFSNFGNSSVDIAAPGVGIYSTEPNNSYGYRNGTSMSTPHVTGAAVLVYATHPDATVAEVKSALLQGAQSKASLQDKVNGTRSLNATGAINAATFAPRAMLVEASSIVSPSTRLVVDLNKNGANSTPRSLTQVGNDLFFVAYDVKHGHELWRSDGTSSGTTLIRDIQTGGGSAFNFFPITQTNVNGTLYFVANDGSTGDELWRSDGTSSGTTLVRDIRPGSAGLEPRYLTNINGTLYFLADDGVNGYELWRSDGTSSGTTLVRDIRPGGAGSDPRYLINVNGTLYFQAGDGANGYELWRSNGTSSGTTMVRDIRPGSAGVGPSGLTNVNGTLYFRANDGVNGSELWRSNGTSSGTTLVRDIRAGVADANLFYLTNINGTLYFRANDGSTGDELWRSDGTSSGTTLVRDIRPGSAGASPRYLANANGTLYFAATDDVSGTELWRSDGTSSGTTLVRDIFSGNTSAFPYGMTDVKGTLYFGATDDISGTELWRSDGTSSGTTLVCDIRTGTDDAFPANLTDFNGTLHFLADDGNNGPGLWRSDGTSSGTKLVRDIQPGTAGEVLQYLINVNGTLYFLANDGNTGAELWRSDGTSSGTKLVRDIRPGSANASLRNLTNVNGTLYFRANDGSAGYELWRSDGTSSGTTLVRDIRPGSAGASPKYLTNVNGSLFFAAVDGSTGYELWRSDGTSSGTTLIRDINVGNSNSNPFNLTNVNGTLYFRAFGASSGEELWRSDGTSSGTTLVRDIRPGSDSSGPYHLTNVNGALYFGAFIASSGVELWRSDGTSSGTTLVRDIRPGSASASLATLTNFNGLLYFRADDGINGEELWRSDGTSSGTTLVRDIRPGSASASLRNLTNVNGTLYFAANDGNTGSELWRSDGTSSGTALVYDAIHGTSAGLESFPVAVGDQLFVRIQGAVVGIELFQILDRAPEGTSNSFTITYSSSSGVASASSGTSDVIVRRVGFPKYDGRATELVSSVAHTDGSLTVTYRVSAPGVWDSTDNGVYEIVLQSNEVFGVNGLAASESVLGSFTVDIPDPNVFFVNTTDDTVDTNPGDGLALDANGKTSLRAAIMEANTLLEYQTIVIPKGTYTLTRSGADDTSSDAGDFDISGDLFIVGAGPGHTIIDAEGLGRIFDVQLGTLLDVEGVTLNGGYSLDQGGAVRVAVSAEATFTNVVMDGNSARLEGGAIFNDGTLSIIRSTLSNNETLEASGRGGGGLFNRGTVTIESSTFSTNLARGGAISRGGGGAILNDDSGIASLVNSTISTNLAARRDGGGIWTSGALSLTQTTITANNAPQGEGGGVYNENSPATPSVFDTAFGFIGSSQLEFRDPEVAAFGPDGNLYIGDTANHRIQVFNSQYQYLRTIGSLGIGGGQFNTITDIAVAADGRIAVVETGNARFQVLANDGTSLFSRTLFQTGEFPYAVAFDAQGRLCVAFGFGRWNVYNTAFEEVGSFNVSGQFVNPRGAAIDTAGRLYIADAQLPRVLVYNSSGQHVQTITKPGNPAGFADDVTIGPDGRMYIVDATNKTIDVYTTAGAFVTSFGSSGTGPGQFTTLAGVAVSSDSIVGIDKGPDRAVRFSIAGSFVANLGASDNGISPRGLAASPGGNVFVTDIENHRVQVFNAAGQLLRQFGQPGTGLGEFSAPAALTLDGFDRLVVADTGNHRVQVLNTSGIALLTFGSAGTGNGAFNSPSGIAIDVTNNIYVADSGNHRVQVFSTSGSFVRTFSTGGTLSSEQPRGLAVKSNGEVYVATGDRVRVFDSTGSLLRSITGMLNAADVDFSSEGRLYITEQGADRVRVFDGNDVALYNFGTTGTANGAFRQPQSVASAGSRVFVADLLNDRTQAFRQVTASRTVSAAGTIIAGNIAAANEQTSDVNSSGGFLSEGYNIVGLVPTSAPTSFTAAGDQRGVYPTPLAVGLGPLALNGATLQTHSLLPGSVARDASNPSLTLQVDQRGVRRVADGNGDGLARADIGAFEAVGGSVQGTVFVDRNSNGVRDLSEVGEADWTVYLDFNANKQLDADEPRTSSRADDPATVIVDESGTYTLADVTPGAYSLRLVSRSGYELTSPVVVLDEAPTLTSVARTFDTSDPVSGDIFHTMEAVGFDGDDVIFNSSRGVYRVTPQGQLIPVITEATTVPGTTTTFRQDFFFDAAASDGQIVAFGYSKDGFAGLYSYDEVAGVQMVADGTTTVPGKTSPFQHNAFESVDVASDLIGFIGRSVAGSFGFYLSDGESLYPIIETGTMIPGVNVTPGQIQDVSVNDEGFAFRTQLQPGGTGIFAGSRADDIIRIAQTGVTTLPGANRAALSLGKLVRTGDRVAFQAQYDFSSFGIFAGTSSADLVRLVDTQTVIPGTTQTFNSISYETFGFDGTHIAFRGDTTSGVGLYTTLTGQLTRVLGTGDVVAGRTVSYVAASPDSISGNRIVFTAFYDGSPASRGVILAEYPVDHFAEVNVSDGRNVASVNFGVAPASGNIAGEVFLDGDADAVRDVSESAYANLVVYLDQNNNRARDSSEAFTTSDALGRYQFNNLATLVSYTVAVEGPAGFVFTTPGATNFNRHTLTLGAGEARESLNFGLAPSGGGGGVASDSVVQGRLYVDSNSNGRYDSGEALLSNRQVFLDFNNNGVREGNEPLRTTDAQGFYSFTNLAAGAYSVRVVSQVDMVQTSPLGNQLSTTTATTGDGPETIATGDFNRDGLIDLVVANTETNNVSLLLNLGNGVLAAPRQLATGGRPSGLAVADFNQDGWDDLAVTNYYAPLVSLFLNTQSAANPFSGAQSIALPDTVTLGGYGSRGVTVADINQDGRPDLVVANEYRKTLAILTNQGTGAAQQLSYSGAITLSGADGLVSGQFTDDNGDTLYNSLDRIDLAALNFDTGQVTVLRNDGGGLFNTLGVYNVGLGAYGVTAADVSGDGRTDLITANFTANTVSVLVNSGGVFAAAVNYVAGAGPTSVVAVDLDNDGDRDLAVSNKSSRQVSILRNNGAGVFGTPDNLGVADLDSGVAFSVTAADLNRDQIADLVVTSNQRSTVSILRNTLVTGSYRVQLSGVNTASSVDFGMQLATSAPSVNLSAVNSSLSETGGATTVIATLSNSWGLPITVDVSFSGTALLSVDYQASAAQILILPGQTSGSITLTTVGDNLSEAAESITVDIASVSGGVENGTQQVSVTIVDDDPLPVVTLSLGGGSSLAENGGESLIVATLSSPSGQAVSVQLSFGGSAVRGTDYSTLSTVLTIPAGQTVASLALSSLDDGLDELNESITAAIQSASGATPAVQAPVAWSISDDDAPPSVSLSVTPASLGESGGTAQVIATLSAFSGQSVTVNVSLGGAAVNNVDYSASATVITIPAGSLTGAITLASLSDSLDEANEAIDVSLATPVNATLGSTVSSTVTIIDDDPSPAVSLSVGNINLAENGATTIVATLAAVSGRTVTVDLGYSGAATLGVDYTSAAQIVIPAGSLTGSVTLTSVDDTLDEANEALLVEISGVTNANENGVQQQTVTILDNDNPPTVTLELGAASLVENGGNTTIAARLSSVSGQAVTVNLLFSGAAVFNTDYTAPTQIIIPAGSTLGTVTLSSLDDSLDEANEGLLVEIGSVTSGTELGTQQQSLTLFDDDSPPTVSLTTSTTSLAENGGTLAIIARLSSPSGQPVTVNLQFGGGATFNTDYSAPVQIIIPAGSTSGSVSLTALNDGLFENSESITVDLGAIVNGTAVASQQRTLTLVDDESTPVIDWLVAQQTASETSSARVLTARLSIPSAEAIVVPLQLSGSAQLGADYSLSANSLTIPAGATSGSVTLTLVDDLLHEAEESALVTFGTPSGGAVVGASPTLSLQITDNDPLPLVTLSIVGRTLAENGGAATVTATLSAISGQDVIVQLSTSGTATLGADYALSATTLSIPAGQTAASVLLTSLDDLLDETNESIVIDLLDVSGATSNGTQQLVATIQDDDDTITPVVQLAQATRTVSENIGAINIVVTLSSPAGQSISVPFALGGSATSGSDYTISSSPLSIPAGQTSAAITLTILDDGTDEATETLVVNLGAPVNATLGAIASETVFITDDDTLPTVSLSSTVSTLAENGGTATVVATLSVAAAQDVTVDLGFTGAALNSVDYSASSVSIVIPAGQLSGSVTLTGRDDRVNEGNESLVVAILGIDGPASDNGTQQISFTLLDDPSDPFTLAGSQLTILGTAADDNLVLQFLTATTFSANLNGASQVFSLSQVDTISFDSLAGNDTLLFAGNANPETAALSTTGVTVSGAGYTFSATNLEYKYLFGDTSDSVTLSDSAGGDLLYQLPAYSLMFDSTVSYYNQAIGFGNVTANATSGLDILLVYGTAGNDTYSASTTNSTLTSAGLSLFGNNFEQVFAFGSGGNDAATFTGSSGDEVFYGLGGYGYSVVNNAVYLQYLIGFSQTTVSAGSGNDGAIFFDAAGNDTFTASPNSASMSGPGFSDTANGFDSIYAFATGGGVDTANLDGSSGDDIFFGNTLDAVLYRPGVYLLQVSNFEQVNALLSSSSGNDTAELIDGFGNDVLSASGATAELTYAAGNKIKLAAFDTVYAKNQNGGTNTKQVINPLAYQLVFEGTWA